MTHNRITNREDKSLAWLKRFDRLLWLSDGERYSACTPQRFHHVVIPHESLDEVTDFDDIGSLRGSKLLGLKNHV